MQKSMNFVQHEEEEVQLEVGVGCKIASTVTVRGRGVVIVRNYVTIEQQVVIDLSSSGTGKVILDDRVKLKIGCVLRCYGGTIEIGARTSFGEYGIVYGHGGVVIGEGCGIGPHCSVHASSHIYQGDLPIRFQGESARGIVIGEGVWLGAGVRVLDNVRVGDNAAVGANSVVNRSLPPRMVCLGSPCKPVMSIYARRSNRSMWED